MKTRLTPFVYGQRRWNSRRNEGNVRWVRSQPLVRSSMHSQTFAFLTAGAIAVLIVAGCAKGSDQSTTSSSTTTTTTASTAPGAAATSAALSAAAAVGPKGDAAHGKAIFSANCA